GVTEKRFKTHGRVLNARLVGAKRLDASGRFDVRALAPVAVLPVPVVLNSSANAPVAVLSLAVVLFKSGSQPSALVFEAVVRVKSAELPNAELPVPVVLLPKAKNPTAVSEASQTCGHCAFPGCRSRKEIKPTAT